MNFEELKPLMEIKRNGMKFTDKDYTFSDYLPNNLKEYEQDKPKRINELENQFLFESNIALELANRFVHGELKGLNTFALKKELEIHKGNKKNKNFGKIGVMYKLNQEYERLTGNRHPCYDQYVNHIWVVASELEKEIKKRKINKLEKRFAKQADKSVALCNKIKNGEIKGMDDEALFELYENYENRVVKIDEKREYRTPDYVKHLNCSNTIFADLDLEIVFRDEELNGEF